MLGSGADVRAPGASSDRPTGGSYRTSIVVTTGVLLAAIFSGKLVLVAQVPTQSIMLLAADGLLAGLIDQFAIYWGLRLNETSRVVPFTSAYPIVTVLLARLYLGEHLTTGKMLGALLIVAGLFLVRK